MCGVVTYEVGNGHDKGGNLSGDDTPGVESWERDRGYNRYTKER